MTREITTASDLKPLQEIVEGIIGELCWQASLSYGDELSLDIGQKIPYTQKGMAGEKQGSWILGCRASEWALELSGKVIASSNVPMSAITN